MALPVATRSPKARKGFCPRCDAPLYSDEEGCRYCVGVHGPNLPPLETVALGLGAAALLALAAVAAARMPGH